MNENRTPDDSNIATDKKNPRSMAGAAGMLGGGYRYRYRGGGYHHSHYSRGHYRAS